MIQNFSSWIGVCTAVLTSLSYIPQVQKAWPRGSTSDLSLTPLVVLTMGLTLWASYGVSRGDWVIIGANGEARHCQLACWHSRSATSFRPDGNISRKTEKAEEAADRKIG